MSALTSDQFATRLARMCLKGVGTGLPRKRLDQHILFKSIALTLDSRRAYTETEINGEIVRWLTEVGRFIHIDHVNLRRCLIDDGYLQRDPAGTRYTLHMWEREDLFSPETSRLDPWKIIREASEAIEQRRRRHRAPPATG